MNREDLAARRDLATTGIVARRYPGAHRNTVRHVLYVLQQVLPQVAAGEPHQALLTLDHTVGQYPGERTALHGFGLDRVARAIPGGLDEVFEVLADLRLLAPGRGDNEALR